MRRFDVVPYVALLLVTALSGCARQQYLIVEAQPPGAAIEVLGPGGSSLIGDVTATGRRYPVDFEVGAGYQVRVQPPFDLRNDFRPVAQPVDPGRYAALPIADNERTRVLTITLPRRAQPQPVAMTFEFRNVRERVEDGRTVYDEWEVIRRGIRERLTTRFRELGMVNPPSLSRFLSAMDSAGGIVTDTELFDTATLKLQLFSFTAELDDLSILSTITQEIAELGQQTEVLGPGSGIPEFHPLAGEIVYRTSFVESRLSIGISGLAPVNASVFLFPQDAPINASVQPIEVRRAPGTTRWSIEGFRVAPGRRYVYGYSEEPFPSAGTQADANGFNREPRVTRKAFRVDIFEQVQTEIPFGRLEELRRSEP